GGVVLVDAELVEVVVGGRRLELRRRLAQAEGRVAGRGEGLQRGRRGRGRRAQTRRQRERRGARDQLAAAQVEVGIGDLTRGEPRCVSNQHGLSFISHHTVANL